MTCGSAMKPIIKRRIVEPNVMSADVIRNLILNNFQTERMSLFNQLAQGVHVAEVCFDTVIIYRTVTVIRGVRTPRFVAGAYSVPILVPGREPERGHAKLFQIRQMFADAAEISAMIGARILAVVRFHW